MKKNLVTKIAASTASILLFGLAIFSITELSIAKVAGNQNTHFSAQGVVNKPPNRQLKLLPINHDNIPSKVKSATVNKEQHLLKQIPYHEVKSGRLFFKNAKGYFAQLSQNSDYRVEVNGLLARVYFSQTFTNDSDEFLEAVYVFPLSAGAAVDAMVMEIGDRRIVGSIKEKQQAKKLYQQAKRQGKKASLVSQQRPNMFTTKVANIGPHQTIKVSLSYLQAINFNDDKFSLRLPLTITPRYIVSPRIFNNVSIDEQIIESSITNKNDEQPLVTNQVIRLNSSHGWATTNARVVDANEITPPQTHIPQGQKVSIAIKINSELALANITSSYHRISQKSTTTMNNTTLVNLLDKKILLDRDFVLQWQLSEGESPKAAFFSDSDDEHNYGLLMLMPPKGNLGKVIAKEVVYIIDVSGSMGGVAIKQAKLALTQAMILLNAQDSFNIIAFNDQTKQLFSASQRVSDDSRYHANQWINQLQAGGGTDMLPALELALSRKNQSNGDEKKQHRQVIFITDGAVGNETELFNIIEQQLGNTRLHTIGIGSAPNGYFMQQAAQSGRGSYRYIGKINEVQQQMQQLFDDISRPMMTDIHIDWPSDQMEILPNDIPDLYAGQPLVISVRWKKAATEGQGRVNKVIVSGKLAAQPWRQSLTISMDQLQKQKFSGISTWWGRQKIKQLSSLYRRSSGEQHRQFKAQITNLALKHSLLSAFTSFVAIEEKISRTKNSKLTSQAIVNVMPQGSTQRVPLANTALGLMAYLYLGAVMLVIALCLALLSLPQWLVLKKPLKTENKASKLLVDLKK